MQGRTLSIVLLLVFGTCAGAVANETELVCVRTARPPILDGEPDEGVWERAPALVTHDPIAGIDILIRAVHTEDRIFVLVQFPDATENRAQKDLVWKPGAEHYETGPAREDTFAFKWSLEPFPVDLTLQGDEPYKADLWFWKAHRTDPVGYADDKIHVYSETPAAGAAQLISAAGRAFYLTRNGDRGDSAYRPLVYDSYAGDSVTKYALRQPTDSRADIRAKGRWRDGRWTIEMGRPLDTGHPDDLQFDPNQRYQFGVSRFEIAGRTPNPDTGEPHYGSGEITGDLWLRFE